MSEVVVLTIARTFQKTQHLNFDRFLNFTLMKYSWLYIKEFAAFYFCFFKNKIYGSTCIL